jgi:hypothetical protein
MSNCQRPSSEGPGQLSPKRSVTYWMNNRRNDQRRNYTTTKGRARQEAMEDEKEGDAGPNSLSPLHVGGGIAVSKSEAVETLN